MRVDLLGRALLFGGQLGADIAQAVEKLGPQIFWQSFVIIADEAARPPAGERAAFCVAHDVISIESRNWWRPAEQHKRCIRGIEPGDRTGRVHLRASISGPSPKRRAKASRRPDGRDGASPLGDVEVWNFTGMADVTTLNHPHANIADKRVGG